jgi:hypothetical protein
MVHIAVADNLDCLDPGAPCLQQKQQPWLLKMEPQATHRLRR